MVHRSIGWNGRATVSKEFNSWPETVFWREKEISSQTFTSNWKYIVYYYFFKEISNQRPTNFFCVLKITYFYGFSRKFPIKLLWVPLIKMPSKSLIGNFLENSIETNSFFIFPYFLKIFSHFLYCYRYHRFPYVFLSLFLIDQHLRLPPWTSVLLFLEASTMHSPIIIPFSMKVRMWLLKTLYWCLWSSEIPQELETKSLSMLTMEVSFDQKNV